MITVLVGHRGTGKSELMQRMQLYLPDMDTEFVDLDLEIQKKIGRNIGELFKDHGEAYFRDLERQIFAEVLQENKNMFICLGAGFDLSVIPASVRVLWVRRKTDLDGRTFLDRPRLNPSSSPLAEFTSRAEGREKAYRAQATQIYTMPEGVFKYKNLAMLIEKEILFSLRPNVGGCLTLLPDHFKNPAAWGSFCERFQGRSILLELRDDLLSREQIDQALMDLAGEKWIYSFRKDFSLENIPICDFYDWSLEGPAPLDFLQKIPLEKRILSLHYPHEHESLEEMMIRLNRWQDQVAQVKFSPRVDQFEQLKILFDWQQQAPAQRSLLPRSAHGRWGWFRCLMRDRQMINYWREGEGSALDQPSLFEWLALPSSFGSFAAVLGDPVQHSYTPLEHLEFFAKQGAPVLAVQILREEWLEALPVLDDLGLRWAAVTSPHKEAAALWCADPFLKAVNTLMKKGNQWIGTSTDGEGFLALIEGIGLLAPLQKNICVWGGGGTLEMLQQALPRATYFSARTGRQRPGLSQKDEENVESPQVLIWAASRAAETQMPPSEWKPLMVIDLNYKEDSMGREYAQICGANYQSGLQMFLTQAQWQKFFWNKGAES